MLNTLKSVAAILCLCALTVLAIQTALLAHSARKQALIISGRVQRSLDQLDATVRDLDRTTQIAGGAINQARQIERDNRKEIATINQKTSGAIEKLDGLMLSLDDTTKQAGRSLAQTSATVAQTSEQLAPVLEQTTRDLRELQPAIGQIAPLLLQVNDIAANLNASTADVAHEIHKFVYPPPRKWYQRYIADPARIGAKMVTIPLRR